MQYLKGQGYIVAAKNSRKAGYAASGKPLFVAVKEGPDNIKMLKDLFDPMTHVGHHVRHYESNLKNTKVADHLLSTKCLAKRSYRQRY